MSLHERTGSGNRSNRSDILAGAAALAFTLVWLGWLSAPATAQTAAAAKPVKISIQPQAQSVALGGQMQMNCVLQDANNRPTKAPKDMAVQIEVKWPSGKTKQWSVTVKEGASSYDLTVPADESGIAEIQARQKELLNGGTFIKVKKAGAVSRPTTISAPS